VFLEGHALANNKGVPISSFQDLLVWQKSMNLAERCNRLTRRFTRGDQAVLGFEIRK
jgi:hypothetical protein